MGNFTSCNLITSDDKIIQLGHVKNAQMPVPGSCTTDSNNINTCNYVNSDIQQMLANSGSTTKIIKQIVVSYGTIVYIYDQDYFTGNKYILYPGNNFIVPPCFTIKSIKQIPVKDPNDNTKLASSLYSSFILPQIEPFNSVNIKYNYKIVVLLILLIIVIYYLLKN